MKYVYILQSQTHSEHFYTGITDDLKARISKHNSSSVPHSAKYGPWRLKTYIAFTDEGRAVALEKYLKSGSGRAFAKKHL
ncbi:MAG TPA: GIY-YIG nuclease family protein [Candidatus Limnocylindrales bacterium]|nr:GIY-YIG nuclease family protein [Candidatus Limnocylindrales bacterium]